MQEPELDFCIFAGFSSELHQFFQIFSGASAVLIREMYNITILSVGLIQDMGIVHVQQIAFDPIGSGLKKLFHR